MASSTSLISTAIQSGSTEWGPKTLVMRPDSALHRNPRLIVVPGSDGYAAYQVDTGRLHSLNESAVVILGFFDGTRTIGDLCAELEPTLGPRGVDATKQWIGDALSEGLLGHREAHESFRPLSASEAIERAQKFRDEGQILAAYVCQYHASELTPENPEVWMALGELAHILGRREEARHAYEEYLFLSPDDAEIRHILRSLRDEPAPTRAPDECVRQLYARFADFYEENMCDDLDYQAPSLLAGAVRETVGTRNSLDVLDLGCGTGLIARHLRPLALRLTGVDLSPEMIERARQTGFYDLLKVDEITKWLSRDSEDTFDVIVACDTLIYFGDLSQVVVPAAKRLAPNGTMAFTVESGDCGAPFRLTDSGRYTHTIGHIASVAQDAGLRVDRMSKAVMRYEYGEPVEGVLAVFCRS